MLGHRSSRQLLYVPLTHEDEQARGQRLYRVGRWIDRHTLGEGAAFALICAVALPVALVLDPAGADELTTGQMVLMVSAWLLSVLVLYAFWIFKRQERSEHRRAYRFTEFDPDDDLEAIASKQVLLARESLESERDAAAERLLAYGALVPYRPSLAVDVLMWIGTIVFVCLAFALLIWLL